jgi:hypothetical protein
MRHSCRAPNFLCFELSAGRAGEQELFQTRSKFWDRPEVQHDVAARGAKSNAVQNRQFEA